MGLDLAMFDGAVDPAYICGLCQHVLLNPVTAGCQHMFCQVCVRRGLKSRTSRPHCPACSTRLAPNMEETSVEFKLKLLDLKIACSHKCGHVFILAELPDHAEVCPNAPVECEFKSHGCKRTVKRCDLRRHAEECDFRFVECEACGYRTIYRDLFTHQSRVRCLEKKLKQQIIRERKNAAKEINTHRERLFRDNVRLEQHQRKTLLKHSKSLNYLYDRKPVVVSRRVGGSGNSESDFEVSPRGEEAGSPRGSGRGSPRLPMLTHSRIMNHDQHNGVVEEEKEERDYQIVTRTPHSSRSGFALQICSQCDRKFRMDTNHPTACRWHIGVQVFTCFACGRLDYQPGCTAGFHRI